MSAKFYTHAERKTARDKAVEISHTASLQVG